MLTFKRNELSIELITQLSIHLAMVLLSKTQYPVESGLQAIFQSSTQEYTYIRGFLFIQNDNIHLSSVERFSESFDEKAVT